MGKQRPSRRVGASQQQRRFAPYAAAQQQGNERGQQQDQPVMQVEGDAEEILPGIANLTSADSAERERACEAIASMTQDNTLVAALLEKNILPDLAQCLSDRAQTVGSAAAGALRNLVIEGQKEVIDQLVELDIIPRVAKILGRVRSTVMHFRTLAAERASRGEAEVKAEPQPLREAEMIDGCEVPGEDGEKVDNRLEDTLHYGKRTIRLLDLLVVQPSAAQLVTPEMLETLVWVVQQPETTGMQVPGLKCLLTLSWDNPTVGASEAVRALLHRLGEGQNGQQGAGVIAPPAQTVLAGILWNVESGDNTINTVAPVVRKALDFSPIDWYRKRILPMLTDGDRTGVREQLSRMEKSWNKSADSFRIACELMTEFICSIDSGEGKMDEDEDDRESEEARLAKSPIARYLNGPNIQLPARVGALVVETFTSDPVSSRQLHDPTTGSVALTAGEVEQALLELLSTTLLVWPLQAFNTGAPGGQIANVLCQWTKQREAEDRSQGSLRAAAVPLSADELANDIVVSKPDVGSLNGGVQLPTGLYGPDFVGQIEIVMKCLGTLMRKGVDPEKEHEELIRFFGFELPSIPSYDELRVLSLRALSEWFGRTGGPNDAAKAKAYAQEIIKRLQDRSARVCIQAAVTLVNLFAAIDEREKRHLQGVAREVGLGGALEAFNRQSAEMLKKVGEADLADCSDDVETAEQFVDFLRQHQ